jgi:hypothetical protein
MKMDQIEQLRRLQKPELAVSLAALVREVLCPGNEWTLERGRDCVEVLLIAARMAFPTSADIESLGRTNTISKVAVELADQIDVIKEEAKKADEESP